MMGVDKVMEVIMANGVFAVLFFFLLMLEIKDSRRRENKYQNVIEKLTEELHIVRDMSDDVDEVLHRVITISKERMDEENK